MLGLANFLAMRAGCGRVTFDDHGWADVDAPLAGTRKRYPITRGCPGGDRPYRRKAAVRLQSGQKEDPCQPGTLVPGVDRL